MSSLYGSICLSEIQWKEIRGYEGVYLINNNGTVKSMDRNIISKSGRVSKVQGIIKKPFQNRDGRLIVELNKNGKRKKYLVYRLLAEAFIPNPNGYGEVNHIDENPSNDSLENLEWCDHKYNINYGTRTKRAAKSKQKPIGVFSPNDDILIEVFSSLKETANLMRVSKNSIINGIQKQKSVKGYNFKYL